MDSGLFKTESGLWTTRSRVAFYMEVFLSCVRLQRGRRGRFRGRFNPVCHPIGRERLNERSVATPDKRGNAPTLGSRPMMKSDEIR